MRYRIRSGTLREAATSFRALGAVGPILARPSNSLGLRNHGTANFAADTAIHWQVHAGYEGGFIGCEIETGKSDIWRKTRSTEQRNAFEQTTEVRMLFNRCARSFGEDRAG